MSAFPSTRWSQVLMAAEGATAEANEALTSLCQHYWYPLYAYVRRRGYSPHDAEDLTQEFFRILIEENLFARADREKGRLRTYLLTCLTRFLSRERARQAAVKRGGEAVFVSLNVELAEEQYRFEPADHVTPDMLFERAWAAVVLENARYRLHQQFIEAGKEEMFHRLQHVLQGRKDPDGLAGIAAALGKSEAAIKMEAMRMRQRYRTLVHAEVQETVADPGEVEDELRHLLRVLAGT